MNRPIETRVQPALAIFDLDGTLIEFHHDYLFAQAAEIIIRLGYNPLARDEMESYFEEFDFFQFVDEGEREAFVEKFWEFFDWENFPRPKPLAGAAELLAELSQAGVKVAIATARITPEEELRELLADTGFLEHVSCLATRPSESVCWTDKTGHIQKICSILSIEPGRALMVGDTPTDIASAKQAGIGVTVAVTSGGLLKSVLEGAGPDFIISDIASLRDMGLFDNHC